MDTEQILMTLTAATVPTAIASVAWFNRALHPFAARLFIAAAVCLLLQIGFGVAEQLLDVNDLYELTNVSEPNFLDDANAVGDEFNPGSPGWRRMIAWQFIFSGFDIVAWSLMAWAILRRPAIDSPTAISVHT